MSELNHQIVGAYHYDFSKDVSATCPELQISQKDQIAFVLFYTRQSNDFFITKEECRKKNFTRSDYPHMNQADQHLFREHLEKSRDLNPNCMTYVEWGSGGSTLWALQFARRILSIENNPEWCRRMSQDPLVQ